MADNYLENQYEQYRARKAAWEKAKKSGKAQTLHKPTLPLKKGGKKVFVTGGAGGIGKAIVEAFCKLNYQVAFCDKNELEGQQTAQATGAQFYPVDLNSKEALELCLQNIFKEWGDIDIIINNAGISEFSPITETSVETFDKILSVNLRPVFITSHALAVHRKSQNSTNTYGRIINLCSTRYLMSEPGSEGYAASKGGIYSLTHALALSLAEWTSRSTPSLRAGFRHTIMNNYGQKTIHNIPPDGLANRKILPVCAYSYVKTRTTSSMAKTSPLTEA